MRGVDFDFPNTCPRIDKEINAAQSAIYSFLDGFLEDACPLLSKQTHDEIVARESENLFKDLESAFETVRETNEQMRREASSQITQLKSELSSLEAQLAEYTA